VLTVATNGATQRGTFTFTVTGQSTSGIVRTVQATLSVRR
jgi:hypothetical protein